MSSRAARRAIVARVLLGAADLRAHVVDPILAELDAYWAEVSRTGQCGLVDSYLVARPTRAR